MWRVAGEPEQTGGSGGPELAEDGSQRVHGGRTGPLSLSRTHVSSNSLHLCSALRGVIEQIGAIPLMKS